MLSMFSARESTFFSAAIRSHLERFGPLLRLTIWIVWQFVFSTHRKPRKRLGFGVEATSRN
jgi:hypothetical protein